MGNTPMNYENEKRRHPRVALNWPVDLITPQDTVRGETSNISVGGALFLFSEIPEIGDEFKVILQSSEEHRIPATCKKVRSYNFNINGSVLHGIGARFTKITSVDRGVIATLVDVYQMT
jgi:hypothetical protein